MRASVESFIISQKLTLWIKMTHICVESGGTDFESWKSVHAQAGDLKFSFSRG